jgi:hypothetical protein
MNVFFLLQILRARLTRQASANPRRKRRSRQHCPRKPPRKDTAKRRTSSAQGQGVRRVDTLAQIPAKISVVKVIATWR